MMAIFAIIHHRQTSEPPIHSSRVSWLNNLNNNIRSPFNNNGTVHHPASNRPSRLGQVNVLPRTPRTRANSRATKSPHPSSKLKLIITSPNNHFSGPSTSSTSPVTHLGTPTSHRLNLPFAALTSLSTIALILPLPLPLKTFHHSQPMLNDVYKPQRRGSSRQ